MMRVFLAVFFLLSVWPSRGLDKITSVTVNSRQLNGIRDVSLNTDGRVIILHSAGGTILGDEKLPDAFLDSWGVKRETARQIRAKKASADLERAVGEGLFREVDGVVYDLRKTQSGWVSFFNVKVVRALKDRTIINATPDVRPTLVMVRNLPPQLTGPGPVSFVARPVGAEKPGDSHVPRAYDAGRPCQRAEIPEALLHGILSSAPRMTAGKPAR